MVHVITNSGKHDLIKPSMLNHYVKTGYVAAVMSWPA